MASRSRGLQPGKQAKKHIAQAQDNYRLYLRLLETPEGVRWALVVLFYAALHLVQAHALTKYPNDMPSKDHLERRVYVAGNLGRLFGDYIRLQDVSEQVRYELWYPTRENVEPYFIQEFENIRKHLAILGIAWAENVPENLIEQTIKENE